MSREFARPARLLLPALAAGVLLLPSAALSFAQTARQPITAKPQPAAKADALSDDLLFDAAAKAVTSGDADLLLAKADAALIRSAADRTAAAWRIAVLLAKGSAADALRAYETWAAAARREDAPLLSRLAGGVLAQLDRTPLSELRARALEVRARRGDTAARALLEQRRKAKPETPDSWESAIALARLGDAAGAAMLAAAAREATGSRRVSALGAFRDVPASPAVVEALALALKDGDDMVRDAAADAATGRTSPDLVGPLREVVKSARFTAPLRAAVALMRMGDDTGRPLVDAALAAPLADGRLVAARAYVGRKEIAWIAHVEPLLSDANVLYRVFAAEVLLPVRSAEALRALEPILADENPVLRAEATRVAGLAPAPPVPALRAALGDANPWVRFHAAVALMKPSAPTKPPAR